jgi:hypothetical protein
MSLKYSKQKGYVQNIPNTGDTRVEEDSAAFFWLYFKYSGLGVTIFHHGC